MDLTRRDFLASAVGASSAYALGGAEWLDRWSGPPALDGRSLVVIQLSGGNDGLNTVVPFDDDRYRRARPRLGLKKEGLVRVGDGLGLHDAMAALRPLVDRGELAVVTDVGAPTPDRSHFRSMEIWHSCRVSGDAGLTGWIGRAADALGVRDGAAPAIHVGSTEQPFSLVGERASAPSVVSLDRATIRAGAAGDAEAEARRALLDELAAIPRSGGAARVAQAARDAYALSARLAAAVRSYVPAAAYPKTALAKKLRAVAQVLDAGLATRIFHVELDGFDTHANQADAHAALLRELAGALAAFHEDLRAHGRGDRVLTMAFSEFGRRVAENGSRGTDHGAAGPMLLAGGGVRGGVHGGPPDLESLVEGDVAVRVDFRRVYASVLEGWLRVPSEPVLLGRHEPLPILRST